MSTVTWEIVPVQAGTLGGRFPSSFRFGTVTAAPAVEGASGPLERGRHIWDTYADAPGAVLDGSTPAVACDHVHRYAEDLDLVQGLGARAYRFTVSWPRVQPEGRGRVSAAGLGFYDRLVDGLLERGIEPTVELYHWDLPQAVEDAGGWRSRDTVELFADYARTVADRLADRVAHWVPVHRPMSVAVLGYGLGTHAPGHRMLFDSLRVGHHLMLAHGRAVLELRAAGATSVGSTNGHSPIWPATLDDADVAASKLFHSIWNEIPLDAMLRGTYPADLAGVLADVVRPGDLQVVRQPLDFYGISFYGPHRVQAAAPDTPVPIQVVEIGGHPRTDNGWAVVPRSLTDLLVSISEKYADVLPPLVIAECGAAYNVEPDEGGVIRDDARIDYLGLHLSAVADAMDAGVDVRGFFVRSLLDGWEWNDGLVTAYGLVHVDHGTQVRTPKASYSWFREVVEAHRAGLAPA
jgi:beta-glucosidase